MSVRTAEANEFPEEERPSNEDQAIDADLPSFVGPQAPLERIAESLEMVARSGIGREHRLRLQLLDHFRKLNSTLGEFVGFLGDAAPNARKAFEKAGEMGKVENLNRRDSLPQSSFMVAKWDEWAKACADLAAKSLGIVEALEHFSSDDEQEEILEALSDTQDPIELANRVEGLQAKFAGVERVVTAMHDYILELPKVVRTLVRAVQTTHQHLVERFGSEEEEKKDDDGDSFSLRDLFKPEAPPKFDVPIYKNNPHLTAFLAELTEQIPVETQDNQKNASALEDFKQILVSLGDKQILEWAQTQQMYMRVARVIQNTHAFCVRAFEALEQSGVRACFNQEPGRASSDYERKMRDAMNRSSGAAKSKDAFQAFDSQPLIDAVRNFKPYGKQTPTQGDDADPAKDTDDSKRDVRDAKFVEIFAKLEALLESLSKGESPKAVEPEIQELIELKKGVAKPKDKRSSAQLTRDRKLGVFAYEPTQGALGKISLRRVATENVRYDDVIGASWRAVEQLLEPMARHGELGHLYSYGTQRGKQNHNMLVLGPYGCGKNMFLRALQADPRTVSIKMTYDRLVTPWAHQSESNARLLYEYAHQRRIQHDKPTVICWDEFDTLFGDPRRRSNGGITEGNDAKIKKTLQSIWDGDTIFEGVSTIALSNAPGAIPPPIYRRFGHVVVIKPLEEQERVDLIKGLLSGIPTEHGFYDAVDWESYLERSEFATGDLLGKIYDRVFRGYIDKLEATDQSALKTANDRFRDLAESGKPIGGPERLEVFTDACPGVVLSPREFNDASERVLGLAVNIHQMEQTQLFYEKVEERMAQAFKRVE